MSSTTAKVFLFCFLLLSVSIALAEKEIGDIKVTNNKADYKGITVEPYSMDKSVIKTTDYDMVINKDTKTFYPVMKSKLKEALKEFEFKINTLSQTECADINQFYKICTRTETDFSSFKNKPENKITDEKITELDGYYIISFYGEIYNLDPEFTDTITSTSNNGFFNQTEGSNLGARTSAPVLFMDFNTPAEYLDNNLNYSASVGRYVKDGSIYNNFGLKSQSEDSTVWTTGKIGNSLEFDNVNDYISIGGTSTLSLYKDMTISVWVKSRKATGSIISKMNNDGSGWYFGLYNAYSPSLYLRNSSNTGWAVYNPASVVTRDVWAHLVLVINGQTNNASIYVNGAHSRSENITGIWYLNNSNSLEIGGIFRGWDSNYFNGSIDEIMLFNRVLNSTEIGDLYNNQSIGNVIMEQDTALISYLKLNETSGTTANRAIRTEEWRQSRNGLNNALDFNGINNRVLVSDNPSLNITQNLTLSVWIYPRDKTIDYQTILAKRSTARTTYELYSRVTDRNIGFYSGGSVVATAYQPTLNTWTHIVTVTNTTHTLFYFNGAYNNITNIGLGLGNLPSNFTIGWVQASTGEYFNGTIDEVMVFNRSLSATEITGLYQNQSVGLNNVLMTDANLVSYWSMNESSGLNAYDSKGTNNGTLSNYVNGTSYFNAQGTLTNYDLSSPTYNATGGYDGSGAYQFDGRDDNIFISSVPASSGNYDASFSLWFNVKDTSENAKFLYQFASDNRNMYIYYDLIYFTYLNSVSCNTVLGAYQITTNKWYHVVGVRNGNTLSIYLNGTLAKNCSSNVTSTPTTNYMRIGSNYLGTSNIMNGSIDQVQIWNRALSAQEVLQLYNGTKNNSNYIGKYSNTGDFKSMVFYNTSQTYWNTTFSIADTYSTHTGIVTDNNEINLSHPNLVSYWSLDGNYNGARGLYNGTCTNCPNNATGISSGAMRFDGVNKVINITLSTPRTDLTGNLTFSAWIYPTGTSATVGRIVATGENSTSYGGRLSYISSTQRIYLGDTEGYYSKTVYLNNAWHHVVGVYSGGNYLIYIDGVNQTDLSPTGTTNGFDITNQPITIGGYSDDGVLNNFFNGTIDEVLIYNNSLSQAEVTQLYKSGLSRGARTNITIQTRTANVYNTSDANLVALYSFNGYNYSDSKGTSPATPQYDTSVNRTGCVIGSCTNFDGIDDRLYINPLGKFALTENITVKFWANAKNPFINYIYTFGSFATGGWNILTYNNGFYLQLYNESGSTFDFSSYPITVVNNTWAMYTVVMNKTGNYVTVKTYRNSTLLGSETKLAPGNYNTTGFMNVKPTLGRNNTYDEIMIFNRSLTSTEITNIYNNESSGARILTTDANLMSHWTLDENETLGTDLSNINFQGGCIGTVCPTFTNNGTVGNAYIYDGIDDRINLTTELIGTGDDSACAWIYPMKITAGYGRILDNVKFLIYLDTDSKNLRGSSDQVTFVSTPTNSISVNTWYHTCFVRNSSGYGWIYLNGILSNNGSSGTPAAGSGLMTFGNRNAGDRPFNGTIDELRIYNRTLSAAEVSDLYNLGNSHIQWNAWSTETPLQDGIGSISYNKGLFYQFKNNFYTNDTAVTPYITNYNFSYVASMLLDSKYPYFITIPSNVSVAYLQSLGTVQFIGTDDISPPVSYYINYTSLFTMDNVTGILTNSTTLAAGDYTINVSIFDREGLMNYTIYKVSITKISVPLSLDYASRLTEHNNTRVAFYGSNCITPFSCNLYVNNTEVSNPYFNNFTTGSYLIKYNTSGNENYTDSAATYTLTVSARSYNWTFDYTPTSTGASMILRNLSTGKNTTWYDRNGNLYSTGNWYINGTIAGCLYTPTQIYGTCI